MAQSPLRLHDSLSGQVRELRPRDPGEVSIYVCGPTVYARIHVGNARPFVMFALLKRLLEHEGHAVTLVENITDVNDKIYVAARERGVPSTELAREMTEAYRADTDRLELGRPDHEPLASESVAAIVELIQALLDRDHAYVSGADVYFSVRRFPGYGGLSNRRLEDLTPRETGEPEEERPLKRDPLDFALWKGEKEGEDTAWEAPWGRGRPGWHIECSAMAESILGLDFDIHGGGMDLLFPHHENEIAQTEAGRGRPLARLWVHNGMVRFGEEKMAKSVGNVRLLHEALDEFGRDALVLYFLGGHYRQPLAFSNESLEQAQRSVERIANFCRLLGRMPEAAGDAGAAVDAAVAGAAVAGAAVAGEESDPVVLERRDAFFDALRDDFNTPQALAALFELINEGNRRLEQGERFAGAARVVAEMLEVIGLESLLAPERAADETVRRLAEERERARLEGQFERADALRRQIAERGWQVRDTADGPVLVKAREGGPVSSGGR